jgi:ribose 1,5-bisphosphokinase PhnN
MCSALMRMSLGDAMATNVTALLLPSVCVDHDRIDLMNLTAASPLLATRTLRERAREICDDIESGPSSFNLVY